jgi:2'-5' RNA ligase
MSPLPDQLVDRWEHRAEAPPGGGAVYWHVLLGNHSQVRELATEAQERLSGFAGLHMTPLQWLHITTLIAGTTEEIAPDDMKKMLTNAELSLSQALPITISLERVLYHPEAIVLEVQPDHALDPILKAAQFATSAVTGENGVTGTPTSSWMPHITLCYSTARQSAEPVISALGKRLPSCEITVDALSLVIQRGAERLWDWHHVGTARLGAITTASGPDISDASGAGDSSQALSRLGPGHAV